MEPIIHVKIPHSATFISDLHGKPFILKKIFEDLDLENKLQYSDHMIFILGDFLDRGIVDENKFMTGAETLFDMIIDLKKKFPDQIFVIFGNHEFLHFKNILNNKKNITEFSYEGNIFRLNEERINFFSKMQFAIIAKKTMLILLLFTAVFLFLKKRSQLS